MRATDLPTSYNAVRILEDNLVSRGAEPALWSAARHVTYGELAAEVERVAAALLALDVRPDERVAILAPDSVEWVAVFFAALKVGAVAVGLNTLLTAEDYAFVLEDCGARVLIVDASLADTARAALAVERVASHGTHVIVIGDSPLAGGELGWDAWLASTPDEAGERVETVARHRDDHATLNYSSGTTGEPKGIYHAHKDLPLTAALWGRDVLGLEPSDRTFAGAKLFFTYGLGGNLIFPFYVGASAVLMPASPRDPHNVLATIDRFRPTILYNAPTGYAATLASGDFEQRYDLSSLRHCVSAGEALPAPLWHAWKERTGLEILDGIGSTENFHIFISNRPGQVRPGSSGRAFAGYDLRLVDDQENELSGPGQVGNLWVRGETAALSYLHRSQASRATFRGEWLVTGDKYTVDEDGYWWHAGRSDDMLKVGGIWVSPVEVESTLIAHQAVLECAVVGQVDDAGLVKPKAFVILQAGFEPADELSAALVAHCTDRMAAYKRPRWIVYVAELPKTATGKIQRFRLR